RSWEAPLHQSKIPASPELTAASAGYSAKYAGHGAGQDEGGPLPADIREALSAIVEDCGSDPFMVVGSLLDTGQPNHTLTPSFARHGRQASRASNGTRAASRASSPPLSTAPWPRDSCWHRRRGGRSDSRRC